MGMEQVGLLPAILAGAFVVVALFNAFLPRRGDWLVILAMLAVIVIGFLVIKDFQTYFHDGEFMPRARTPTPSSGSTLATACSSLTSVRGSTASPWS